MANDMEQEFNVNQYWLERGHGYMQEKRTPPQFHRLQEQFLLDVLQRSAVPMQRLLEIGCGFGRITRRLAETWPTAEIVAVDLSPDQLANARRHCAGNPNVRFEPYDFYSGRPFPGRDYSTAIAIEVFLHHPPEAVTMLFRRLAALAGYIVNIDWSEDWPWPTPEHVWVHDFAELYRRVGLKCATFNLPEKIEGKQQKLFIAARELSPALLTIERQLRESTSPAALDSRSADEWAAQLQQAATELLELIPAGTDFILVDDGQWGTLRAFAQHRVFPFLERGGHYWGPPADDQTAIQELERMQQDGAQHIVFAWCSFWWLEHYAGFRRYLDQCGRRILANERVIVFRLTQ